ncbi:hypothetical protein HNR23_003886 [Nocardiopsis mwathae]|uniref:Condensation domain-containing protein n=1 Tax=Nocardiopsis mwathae TaxID=1472723 RepID=A0A7X0D7K4_9ACTN|nr:condensation domain-containing protein [Nocardiopsis mwathae]MBB6173826.1 hypothetical protein [Nocardiopsis mwathae]
MATGGQMKFTEISDIDVEPGALTEWRPWGGPDGSRWRTDERPPSYVQEAHVRGRLAGVSRGRASPSWLATVFDLPGRLDPEAFRTALLTWIDQHETLRSGLRVDGDRITRVTLAKGEVELCGTPVGDYTDTAQLTERLESFFDRETDPLAWPAYACATISRAGSTTVCLGFDHSNVDGYSILLIAQEIRWLYAAAVVGSRPDPTDVGSYLDFSHIERSAAAEVDSDHEAVTRWRDFLAANGWKLPEFPAARLVEGGVEGGYEDYADYDDPALYDDMTAPQLSGDELILDAEQATAFDAACRKSGGSPLAGILTCLGLAGRESLGQDEFRALTIFHTRNHPKWARSLGWYVGLAPVHFPVAGPDTFPKVLTGAADAVKAAKPLSEVPFARVVELLGAELEPRFVVSYVDMRLTPGARYWKEWRMHTLRSRSHHPHEVYLWINRGFDGTRVSFRYPAVGNRATAARLYIDNAAAQMKRVADGGELTASPQPAAGAHPVTADMEAASC